MNKPLSTYRLQLNPGFGFRAVSGIAEYLSRLGITDIYASPIFAAVEKSLHGYDVVDLTRLNPGLGAREEFFGLREKMKTSGMGWLQDIVPNHMAFHGANKNLMDVLEFGRFSPYFIYFDIDWKHPYDSIRGRLLAPFLGKLYAEALLEAEIQLEFSEEGLGVRYYELRLPVRFESYYEILSAGLEKLPKQNDNAGGVRFIGILEMFRVPLENTPPATVIKQVKYAKSMLYEMYSQNPWLKEYIDSCLSGINGRKGDMASFDRLDRILSSQNFRLSFWKVANEEINYRRFFNINSLISVRIEDPAVFEKTHSLIIELAQKNFFTGLRIDHIDGLYDPKSYLDELRKRLPETFIVAEKILEPGEEFPRSWPIQGSTGYEFAGYVSSLLCDGRNEKKLTAIYRSWTGQEFNFRDMINDKKRLIIGKHMAGNIDNLSFLLKKISGRDRYGIDITLYGLKRALVEIMAMFPVYRTYISGDTNSEADVAYIRASVSKAIKTNPSLYYECRFIEKFLLMGVENKLSGEVLEMWKHFVMTFQQLTGPLMAKGCEDTVYYIYNRLISLNEVGGNPDMLGMETSSFHDFCRKRAVSMPNSLSATSTHDIKRGEDVRARINVISEMPEEWKKNLRAWERMNRKKKPAVSNRPVPDKNDEYYFYQTLAGTFPFDGNITEEYRRRIKEYSIKAVREAKVHTAWLKPDQEYEDAYLKFIDGALASEGNEFLVSFREFAGKISFFGMLNSLVQTALKLCVPGVPDFYQGSELWELTLVDPDNRRPVDFGKREKLLEWITAEEKNDNPKLLSSLLEEMSPDMNLNCSRKSLTCSNMSSGAVKLYLIYKLLNLRKENPGLFLEGSYEPVMTRGEFGDNLLSFVRQHNGQAVIVTVPRLLYSVVKEMKMPFGEAVWKDTELILPRLNTAGKFHDIFTGREINAESRLNAAQLFDSFPISILI